MKLPNQTKGPVTLTQIEYRPGQSQETLAFEAVVKINGLKGYARNDGHGGQTLVQPNAVYDALRQYAATLPPIMHEGFPGGLKQTGDSVIYYMVDDALNAGEHAKMRKKGYTHFVSAPKVTSIAFYSRDGHLTDAVLVEVFKLTLKQVSISELKSALLIVKI